MTITVHRLLPMDSLHDIRCHQLLRQRATAAIVSDIGWLIGEPAGGHRWLSTQRDLIEMVRVAWLSGLLTDSLGRRITQQELARRAFGAVSRKAPAQIGPEIAKMEGRQGVPTMVDRYMGLGAQTGIIQKFIK